MAEWGVWFVLAGLAVILEMFTGTFYLLMIALGLAAGGAVALAGAGNAWQFMAAALVGSVATYGLRRSKLGRISRRDAAYDPNVNLDIGQTLMVDGWSDNGNIRTARVMYRGALWDVELEHGSEARPGSFVILAVRGNRLVVANNG